MIFLAFLKKFPKLRQILAAKDKNLEENCSETRSEAQTHASKGFREPKASKFEENEENLSFFSEETPENKENKAFLQVLGGMWQEILEFFSKR